MNAQSNARSLMLNRHPFLIPPKKRRPRLVPKKTGGRNPLNRLKGVGQTTMTTTTSSTPSSAGPIVLMSVGGVALLGGIVGAVVSDTYREDFVIAAAVGLLLDVAGAAWFGSQLVDTVSAQLSPALAPTNPTASYPVVSTPMPGQPQPLPYAAPTTANL